MAARATWKGFIRLSLISIPVKCYTAASSSSGAIHLNQIHKECHNRIRYQKTCPIHGEVSTDDIVSGYEFAKGQFVVIDTDELDKLHKESDKAVNIEAFIEPDQCDLLYLDGKTHYLVPDGPVGEKPFALLHSGIKDSGKYAIAKMIRHGKEEVLLLRTIGKLIAIHAVAFATERNQPAGFEADFNEVSVSQPEKDLVQKLIESTTVEDFDITQYKDSYTENLVKLIEAKKEGKEIVAQPADEPANILNLMDALKASIEKNKAAPKNEKKPNTTKAKDEPKAAPKPNPKKAAKARK